MFDGLFAGGFVYMLQRAEFVIFFLPPAGFERCWVYRIKLQSVFFASFLW